MTTFIPGLTELLGGQIDALAPNETAYVHRQGPSLLVAMAVTLSDPSRAPAALAGLQSVFGALQLGATAGTYVNYPDLDLDDWQIAYWGSNYPKLAEMKRKYDPQNLFRHAQSVRQG